MPSDYDYRQDDRHENFVKADSELSYTVENRVTTLETNYENLQKQVDWLFYSFGGAIILVLLGTWLKKQFFSSE